MKTARGCLLLMLVLGQPVLADQNVDQVVAAVAENQWMPQFGKQLDIVSAYRLQGLAVNSLLAGGRPDGFKAGLTSKPGQQKFAVSQPVAGVLLPGSGLMADTDGDYVFAVKAFRKPMMELEIGFRFRKGINRPIVDAELLKDRVSAVFPVIELPDLGFADMRNLLGTDIIANNVAARTYITGAAPAKVPFDINRLQVVLYRDGQLILAGQGSDAMGDQWQALMWLVNQTLANGWEIRPGQIFITGALGKMLPALPGAYRAEFSGLGQIEWRVE
jgi:2-keto-4-pentenoate hydratase